MNKHALHGHISDGTALSVDSLRAGDDLLVRLRSGVAVQCAACGGHRGCRAADDVRVCRFGRRTGSGRHEHAHAAARRVKKVPVFLPHNQPKRRAARPSARGRHGHSALRQRVQIVFQQRPFCRGGGGERAADHNPRQLLVYRKIHRDRAAP